VCYFLEIWVNQEYPNLNYRVPKITASVFSRLISDNNFYYLNFKFLKLSDPKKSGNPNGQAEAKEMR
jgi:hypothetical protein